MPTRRRKRKNQYWVTQQQKATTKKFRESNWFRSKPDDHASLRTKRYVSHLKSQLTSSVKNSINLAFVEQLWMLCLDGFEFDSYFLSRGHVGSEVDISKGTTPDLATEPVLLSHSKLHFYILLWLLIPEIKICPELFLVAADCWVCCR